MKIKSIHDRVNVEKGKNPFTENTKYRESVKNHTGVYFLRAEFYRMGINLVPKYFSTENHKYNFLSTKIFFGLLKNTW